MTKRRTRVLNQIQPQRSSSQIQELPSSNFSKAFPIFLSLRHLGRHRGYKSLASWQHIYITDLRPPYRQNLFHRHPHPARSLSTALANASNGTLQLHPLKGQIGSVPKNHGRLLFAPECDGAYEIFNRRPLSEDILQYFCQDVEFLPRLWKTYHMKMTLMKQNWVLRESIQRVNLSHMPRYNGQ